MKFVQIKDLYFLSVITLIKAVSLFSSPKPKEFVAVAVASAAYHLSRKKRRLTEKNLSQMFDKKLGEEQKQRITKGSFYELWREIFSLPLSGAERAVFKNVELRGVEYLYGALKEGKGVILWESGFFGRRNLAKQILCENGFVIYQVHGEDHLGGFINNGSSATWVRRHIINPFFETYEKQFVEEIVYLPNSDSLTFTRRLLNLLKQNAIICITADAQFGQKLIPQKFLGRTKLFATGMVSLARISGASILPMFCVQERSGETSLIIERPIQIERDTDRERALEGSVAEYAELLEAYIRQHPEKCRNWHLLDEVYYDRTHNRSLG